MDGTTLVQGVLGHRPELKDTIRIETLRAKLPVLNTGMTQHGTGQCRVLRLNNSLFGIGLVDQTPIVQREHVRRRRRDQVAGAYGWGMRPKTSKCCH